MAALLKNIPGMGLMGKLASDSGASLGTGAAKGIEETVKTEICKILQADKDEIINITTKAIKDKIANEDPEFLKEFVQPIVDIIKENIEKEKLEEPAKEGTEEPAKEGTEEPAKEGTEEPTKEGTEEPAKEGTEEPAKEGTEEPAKEGTEEPAPEVIAEPIKVEAEQKQTGGFNGGLIYIKTNKTKNYRKKTKSKSKKQNRKTKKYRNRKPKSKKSRSSK
jgi:hypothetical protein